MQFFIAEAEIVVPYLVAGLLALPFIAYGIYLANRTRVMREWQPTQGMVLSFKDEFTRYGGRAFVRYSYSVNGNSYEGTRVSVADGIVAQGAWQVHQMRKRFHEGAQVTVRYDPLRPENSCLIRPGYTLCLFVLVFGICSLLGLIWVINSRVTMPPGWHPITP